MQSSAPAIAAGGCFEVLLNSTRKPDALAHIAAASNTFLPGELRMPNDHLAWALVSPPNLITGGGGTCCLH